jgi:hypothetical protein
MVLHMTGKLDFLLSTFFVEKKYEKLESSVCINSFEFSAKVLSSIQSQSQKKYRWTNQNTSLPSLSKYGLASRNGTQATTKNNTVRNLKVD